jgi:hypothetical protein
MSTPPETEPSPPKNPNTWNYVITAMCLAISTVFWQLIKNHDNTRNELLEVRVENRMLYRVNDSLRYVVSAKDAENALQQKEENKKLKEINDTLQAQNYRLNMLKKK